MNTASLAVGVIVPVRNGARRLANAIQSVCDQYPAPADIVVVDGGSEDGSATLAAGFPGVRVITQAGRGLAAARNQGIRAVTGDVIAFCDSDDCWTVGALAEAARSSRRRAELRRSDRPCGECAFRGRRRDAAAGSRLGRVAPGYTPGALMVRRTAFEAVGPFDESLAIGADSDWFVRLAQSDVRLDVLRELVLRKGARASSLSADVTTYRSRTAIWWRADFSLGGAKSTHERAREFCRRR